MAVCLPIVMDGLAVLSSYKDFLLCRSESTKYHYKSCPKHCWGRKVVLSGTSVSRTLLRPWYFPFGWHQPFSLESEYTTLATKYRPSSRAFMLVRCILFPKRSRHQEAAPEDMTAMALASAGTQCTPRSLRRSLSCRRDRRYIWRPAQVMTQKVPELPSGSVEPSSSCTD